MNEKQPEQLTSDTEKSLAFEDGGGDAAETNTLGFDILPPVNNPAGTVGLQDARIQAPLISLVPVPAYLMDEMTVDFTMTVQEEQ